MITIKKFLTVTVSILLILAIITAVAFIRLSFKTKAIDDDYSSVYDDPRYAEALYIDGVDVFTQDVSCGYAVIQMFSSWEGSDVTEQSLYEEYGKVVTSTGDSFCDEMNKRFPSYETTIHKYCTNIEMIDLIYDSLSEGVPVPFEWAALYGDDWTLHYSLIIGLDIPSDKITIANPYGYIEELTLDEFLSRTSYEAYDGMPFFLKAGFAFGIFEKNTMFSVTLR